MTQQRRAYFISDRTGITAESLGNALLTQFDHVEFKRETIPFIDTIEKAYELAKRIREHVNKSEEKPIVFASIVSSEVRQVLKVDGTLFIDFFETFTGELENEFRQKASLSIGKAHGMTSEKSYDLRINAINFSLNHDDGIKTGDLDEAEVILVGVSRSGKTPTCLYLALQYGIKAANYPLTPDDLGTTVLPKMLQPYRNKLFGLTIQPQRLHTIRTERRPDSRYASLENCRFEVNEAESIFRQQRIPYINATHKSIEEIATTILHNSGLTRHF